MSVTLPGDIPGLLRRCSPVVGNFPGAEGFRGTIGAVEGPRVWVADSLDKHAAWLMIEEAALDLSDATGRAHAAWWLAQRLDEYAPRDGAPWLTWKRFHGETGWALMNAANMRWCFTEPGGRWDWMTAVPALTGLDMDDPRTLPDGSRWVDAEALRRVCLHVAGRTT